VIEGVHEEIAARNDAGDEEHNFIDVVHGIRLPLFGLTQSGVRFAGPEYTRERTPATWIFRRLRDSPRSRARRNLLCHMRRYIGRAAAMILEHQLAVSDHSLPVDLHGGIGHWECETSWLHIIAP
jgi:hypothetical protein